MVDLVERARRRLRSSPIGAAIVIVAAVLIAAAAVITALRTVFPPRGSIELTGMTVLNDPDSIAAFRRQWFGDTSVTVRPTRPRPSQPPRARPAKTATVPTAHGREGVVIIGAVPSNLRRLMEAPAGMARVPRSSGPPGTGYFPIIDLKFRNPTPAAAFLTQLEVVAVRRAFDGEWVTYCGVTLPSWEYNVLLDDSLPWQRLTLDISQEVEGDGVDRFVVVVGHDVRADAKYDLDLTVHFNRGARLHLGTVAVELHAPECTGIHPLSNVRAVR
jgi:hypothetical protein